MIVGRIRAVVGDEAVALRSDFERPRNLNGVCDIVLDSRVAVVLLFLSLLVTVLFRRRSVSARRVLRPALSAPVAAMQLAGMDAVFLGESVLASGGNAQAAFFVPMIRFFSSRLFFFCFFILNAVPELRSLRQRRFLLFLFLRRSGRIRTVRFSKKPVHDLAFSKLGRNRDALFLRHFFESRDSQFFQFSSVHLIS